jgi:hypothetical protein
MIVDRDGDQEGDDGYNFKYGEPEYSRVQLSTTSSIV